MNIEEAVARIFRAHKGLLAACLLAGIALGLLVSAREHLVYEASARVSMDAADPTAEAEAAAISDSARAVVTSPNVLVKAVREVGASRDPSQLADDVSVRPIGVSRIVEVSVKDPDPRVAAGLANALAEGLITTRAADSDASISNALLQLRNRIDNLQAQIVAAHKQALADPSSAVVLGRRSDALVQQQLILEQQEGQLLAVQAERPSPSIMDRALTPTSPESSHRIPDLALGTLLGIVVGLGLASLLETYRPTVVGSENLSRELEAPVLEDLERPPSEAGLGLKRLADRLGLAAQGVHVEEVKFIAAGGDPGLKPFVEKIQHCLNGDGTKQAEPRVEPLSVGQVRSNGHRGGVGTATGLVVVAPTILPKEDLRPIRDLLTITRWPLLGVVSYRERLSLRDRLPWPRGDREVSTG